MHNRRRQMRAARILADGNPGRAARKLQRLGHRLDRSGHPLPAAGVRMEAAYAEALGHRPQEALQSALFALDTFADAGWPQRIAPAILRIVRALRQNGHLAEAGELEQRLDQALQAVGATPRQITEQLDASRPASHGSLPAKCPSCGGPLFPDEVEWSDPMTAECLYCGSAVKAS
jgi:hypothetical protein